MIHSAGTKSTTKLTNVDDDCVQPNGVDLRVKDILLIRPDTFTITENEKIHRGSVPLNLDSLGYWVLEPGKSYEIIMDNTVVVGKNEAGWVVTRSTLNRNGVFLTSGLYDSGYDGVMAATIHVTAGYMRLKPFTRVGQYISFKAEALHDYKGSYGTGTEHDIKYTAPAQTLVAASLTEAPQSNSVDTGVYGAKITK